MATLGDATQICPGQIVMHKYCSKCPFRSRLMSFEIVELMYKEMFLVGDLFLGDR